MIAHFWWVCLLLVIVYFIYLAIGYCACLLGLSMGVVFLVYVCTRRGEQRRRRMQDLADRAPFVQRAVNALNQKQFGALSSKAKESDKCIICFTEFVESDEVSELKCDERHIFHTDCIKQWMQSDAENNLKCPICKREVNVDGVAA